MDAVPERELGVRRLLAGAESLLHEDAVAGETVEVRRQPRRLSPVNPDLLGANAFQQEEHDVRPEAGGKPGSEGGATGGAMAQGKPFAQVLAGRILRSEASDRGRTRSRSRDRRAAPRAALGSTAPDRELCDQGIACRLATVNGSGKQNCDDSRDEAGREETSRARPGPPGLPRLARAGPEEERRGEEK